MPRPQRLLFENAWYHVMNRGAGRKYILNNQNNNKETFLELLAEIHLKYEVEIHAYCIMDNHYHLLVRTPKANLSDAIRHLQFMYSRIYNIKRNSDGPIFKNRYKSCLINTDAYLLQVCKYIHLNPIEAKVTHNINYQWSSYKYYIQSEFKPNWLTTSYIKNIFDISNINNNNFVIFHHSEQESNYNNTINRCFYPPKEKLVKNYIKHNPHLTEIENNIITHFDITKTELRSSQRGINNTPKKIFIFIAFKIFNIKLIDISTFLGFNSKDNVAKIIQRDISKVPQTIIKKLYEYKNDMNKLVSESRKRF